MRNSKQLIERYFSALESLNPITLNELLAENIVFDVPYSPKWFYQTLNGKNEVMSVLNEVMSSAQSMHFKIDIRPFLDPTKFAVIFDGEILFKDGVEYNNHYINLFTVQDNKIVYICEYFNPTITEASFKPNI